MIQLPTTPAIYLRAAVEPALDLLPARMGAIEARVQLAAISLQESALAHRWQVVDLKRPQVKGPARGLLQFEQGTRTSRGGVWGVYLHAASSAHLRNLCAARGCAFEPAAIYAAIEADDVLSAGVGRLLLWTDPLALPALGDQGGAWDLYQRCWRPGAYARGSAAQRAALRDKWAANYRASLAAVGGP